MEIYDLVRRHLARITPGTVQASVRLQLAAKPVLIDRRHPAMAAAESAYYQAFGARPVFIRSGGTIPVINLLQEDLGIPTVLMGFALPDDRMHAPNEKLHLPNFSQGIATSICFLAEIGAKAPERISTTQKMRRRLAAESHPNELESKVRYHPGWSPRLQYPGIEPARQNYVPGGSL
jgi:hypothetical protein